MKQIMPAVTNPNPPMLTYSCPKRRQNLDAKQTDVTTASFAVADTHIRPSKEITYETPKREPVREDDDDDYNDEFSTWSQRRLVELATI